MVADIESDDNDNDMYDVPSETGNGNKTRIGEDGETHGDYHSQSDNQSELEKTSDIGQKNGNIINDIYTQTEGRDSKGNIMAEGIN